MSIQFHCPQCAQPIEVDAPLAGKQAQCPYCRQVVVVPATSMLDPASQAVRPTGATPPPPVPPTPAAQSQPQTGWQPPPPPMPYAPAGASRGQATAARLGTLALLATGLSIAAFIAVMIPTMSLVGKTIARSPTTMPTMQESQRLQEELMREYPWYAPTYSAVFLLGITGLVLALVGLFHHRRGNWMIWICLCIYGLGMCMMCGGIAVMVGSMGAGG